MKGTLVTADGHVQAADRAAVESLLGDKSFFWLDLEAVDEDTLDLLSGPFGFHPLAVEDVEHFGQRPKIEDYDSFVLMVVYGAMADREEPGGNAPSGSGPGAGGSAGGLVEVHCFYSSSYLVTVHQGPCPDLPAIAHRLADRRTLKVVPALVLHRVVDTLVDSFFPVLSRMDDDIDQLEDQILSEPKDSQLGTLFTMKRSLVAMRKVVTPERDMFSGLLGGAYDLDGMDEDTERYFRDIYDHLIRISDLVDSYRDLMSGIMDTHLSTVSNRLNVVMKQLTIIATVFLPLTFLTGFFGQNFGWLVGHLGGPVVFWGAGIGLEVLAVAALVWLFRRRQWL